MLVHLWRQSTYHPLDDKRQGTRAGLSNSLFEDNAEFGLGMRLALNQQREFAAQLLQQHASDLGDELVGALLNAPPTDEADIYEQRQRVVALKARLLDLDTDDARQLLSLADLLVKKSVWIIGGDGWCL